MKHKKAMLIFRAICILLWTSFDIFAEEGVTDTEIRIGQFGPLNGPAAAWGDVLLGSKLVFDIVNDSGGIHGRKIVQFALDDSYNPSKTKQIVKDYQEKVGIFAWGPCISSAGCLAVKDYLMNRNIPWTIPASGTEELSNPPNKYLFTIYPLLSSSVKLLSRYAIENMHKKQIAIVYQNDKRGEERSKGAVEELSIHGLQLIAKIPVDPNDARMKTIAQQSYDVHADTVIMIITPFSAVRLLKTARDINFSPQWMGELSFADFPLMYKVSNGLWLNMITVQIADFTDIQLLQNYQRQMGKYIPDKKEWTAFFHGGVAWTEVMVEVLKRCGRNLTRERFVKEMEGIQNFRGIGPTISFKSFDINDPSCRRGVKDLYLTQCLEDGKVKKLTDWIKIE